MGKGENGSGSLLRSAQDQWRTVKKLLRLVPNDHPSRQDVLEEAEQCQSVLREGQQRTPMLHDPQAREAENLASVLDEVIHEAEPKLATG